MLCGPLLRDAERAAIRNGQHQCCSRSSQHPATTHALWFRPISKFSLDKKVSTLAESRKLTTTGYATFWDSGAA